MDEYIKPPIIFPVSKPNLYSYAALLGMLEKRADIRKFYDILVPRIYFAEIRDIRALLEEGYGRLKLIRSNKEDNLVENKINEIRSTEIPPGFPINFPKPLFKYSPDISTDFGREPEHPISKIPYIIIGISFLSYQYKDFVKFMEKILPRLKEDFPRILIITGGWHCTGAPETVLNKEVDYVCVGEGEYSLAAYLYSVARATIEFGPKKIINNFGDFRKKIFYILEDLRLKGQLNHYAYRIEGRTVIGDERIPFGDPRCSIGLDTFPPFSKYYRVYSPIEISRGCPYSCKFCQTGNYWSKMKHASIETVINWIKKAASETYNKVWFLTPNSFAYGSKNGIGTAPAKVGKLLRLISGIKHIENIFFGTFPSEIRPDYVNKEIMDAVHPYISNKYFTMGAQSASNRLLKHINRGHTFEDVLNAMDLILDYGYGVDLDFIFGLPGETEEDRAITLDFFKEVMRTGKPIRIHTHTFIPLPGTPFADEPIGQLTPEVNKVVGELTRRGKAYGQHLKQARFGSKRPPHN